MSLVNKSTIENDLKISTRTVIATIHDCKFDIINIFKLFPLNSTFNSNFQTIFMYNNKETKGTHKKALKKTKTSFRNSVNIIISYKESTYNIKISRLGKFHITGAKNIKDTTEVVKYILEVFLDMNDSNRDDCVTFEKKDIVVWFDIIMTNYIFDSGFKIDKQKLNKLLNETKLSNNFINLYETSFGYTGVNVKKLLDINTGEMSVNSPVFTLNDFKNSNENEWIETKRERTTFGKKGATKFNTYLVFHSGKVIVSGIQEELMEKDFREFQHFILSNKEYIQENIEL